MRISSAGTPMALARSSSSLVPPALFGESSRSRHTMASLTRRISAFVSRNRSVRSGDWLMTRCWMGYSPSTRLPWGGWLAFQADDVGEKGVSHACYTHFRLAPGTIFYGKEPAAGSPGRNAAYYRYRASRHS